MLLQTVTLGYILKHVLNNNAGKAILFAGILLLIAAFFTTFIKSKKPAGELVLPAGGGH
jgi:maltose/moltooligosaccharide transporter